MEPSFSLHSRSWRCYGALLAASFCCIPLAQADYPAAVRADSPRAYFRLDDESIATTVNLNVGSLGAAGNATNDLPVVRSYPGAITGDPDRAAFFDFASRTEIPWNAALNPAATQPFTVEAWFYPASDQINGGQCPIGNRYAYSGVNRQGWVIFQRNPNESYNGKPGSEGIGWNFRMYRGSGGSSGLDVTSDVPYVIGKWTHVAVVYDPTSAINASVVIYIDGVAAKTNTWTGGASGTDPGYAPNTNDHPAEEAINGPAALAIGNYNNTASSLNPFFGAVDEFAFHAKKLTPEEILSHYQNGTNANRTIAYSALIQAHSPVAYLRLNERAPVADTAVNLGDLRNQGVGTHSEEVQRPVAGAIVSEPNDRAVAYHFRNGKAVTTLPFSVENNPSAGVPFSFEGWFKPGSDRQGGQCPVNNRWVGGSGRTGWVIFQRYPNLTYADVPGNNEGHGWNFRMFTGNGNSGQDVLTGTDYRIGEWQHLVFTWQPQTENGDVANNGNSQWEGILTAYVNGQPVATNSAARYAANRAEAEGGAAAADLGIGAYNAASGLGSNPYEGAIDEIAIYNNHALTPAQVLAHFQAGTNAHPAVPYSTLVLTAATEGTGTQRLMPKTYLRFNEPAARPLANLGSAASAIEGYLVAAPPANTTVGPQAPKYPGLGTNNLGLAFDGVRTFGSLNNPTALNTAGQITLEAWIKPETAQVDTARILSHGPPTLSSFLDPSPATNGSYVVSSEVSLRIDGMGTTYSVGASDGTTTNRASASIPAGDLGGTDWIHLVGTYTGTHWKLYRNGTEIASEPSALGAVVIPNADWAIGATGNGWDNGFAGGVDEVAIYDRALTATQVQAHFAAATSTIVADRSLTIVRQGANLLITHSGAALEESATVSGPYTEIPNSRSPYTVAPLAEAKFYRYRR